MSANFGKFNLECQGWLGMDQTTPRPSSVRTSHSGDERTNKRLSYHFHNTFRKWRKMAAGIGVREFVCHLKLIFVLIVTDYGRRAESLQQNSSFAFRNHWEKSSSIFEINYSIINLKTTGFKVHRRFSYIDNIDRVLFYIKRTVMMSYYPHKGLKLACQVIMGKIFANFVT